jgi:uncharacterized protein (DUF305 family)
VSRSKKAIIAALVIAGLAGVASAQTSHQDHGSAQGHGSGNMDRMDPAGLQKAMSSMMPSPDDPVSTRDFKAADTRMMAGMNVPYTGNPDIDFRTKMIPHHQGAIDMARVALAHALDPETKRMAQRIIDDQDKEIAEMQDWLRKHGRP